MSDNIQIQVTIPLDDEGMLGRECLECERYFKLKPGTGLPTDYCHCPYCPYEGDANTFFTTAQNEYMESVALQQAFQTLVKPALDKLTDSFRSMERNTRNNSFFQIKVSIDDRGLEMPIKTYNEKDLETNVACDNCGLVFSVYGVFARCPDCTDFNAFQIYEKSLEVAAKQLELFTIEEFSADIKEKSLGFVLSSCVSAFDALGKELRKRKPTAYPTKPKNLFQNLTALDAGLSFHISGCHSDYQLLFQMFQIRHIFEHNLGVVDQDFITKLPALAYLFGRKYPLSKNEIKRFIDGMSELGDLIKNHFRAVP